MVKTFSKSKSAMKKIEEIDETNNRLIQKYSISELEKKLIMNDLAPHFGGKTMNNQPTTINIMV